ncbi:MAG: PIG-L family deacetylase [Thermoanaerobaculaceae bacterium]|nr:PIG-L family deacetylase [Thermoanaerobaculaceae bacterium]
MIRSLALGPTDRLLVLLPHPDDESVAAGGLLQHALEVGSRLLVVFFTDGDNNPWAQRASELRWRIGPADRARFAARRRDEVRAALGRLGVPLDAVRFLGFPDQGTTDLLLHGNEVAFRAVLEAIETWAPTVVGGPSLFDLHPDHSALAVLAEFALAALRETTGVRSRIRYLVHNPGLLSRLDEGALVLPLSEAQRERKKAAIACHKTQLVLRGSWLLSFAGGDERFYLEESPFGGDHHPVVGCRREGGVVAIEVASGAHLRAFGRRTLCLVGCDGGVTGAAIDLPPHGGRVAVRDPRTGRVLGEGEFHGARGRGTVVVPAELAPPGAVTFAKIEHARGFFDEAGWKALAAAGRPGTRS